VVSSLADHARAASETSPRETVTVLPLSRPTTLTRWLVVLGRSDASRGARRSTTTSVDVEERRIVRA
jgi:hypothetical protein